MKLRLATLTAAAALLLVTIASGDAQRRPVTRAKPSPSPSPRQVTIQSGTTDDGRPVILRSDGTWEYDPNPKPKPTPTPVVEQDSTLSFDTGLVLRSGDVKPVARAPFYLLDTDLQSILSDAGFQREGSSSLLATFALKYVARQLEALRGATVTTYDRAMLAVKPHIVASTTTDFGGKGQFPAVKPETYYLFHVSEIGRNVVLWNLKVDLKPGANSVTLDQNNAAEAF